MLKEDREDEEDNGRMFSVSIDNDNGEDQTSNYTNEASDKEAELEAKKSFPDSAKNDAGDKQDKISGADEVSSGTAASSSIGLDKDFRVLLLSWLALATIVGLVLVYVKFA